MDIFKQIKKIELQEAKIKKLKKDINRAAETSEIELTDFYLKLKENIAIKEVQVKRLEEKNKWMIEEINTNKNIKVSVGDFLNQLVYMSNSDPKTKYASVYFALKGKYIVDIHPNHINSEKSINILKEYISNNFDKKWAELKTNIFLRDTESFKCEKFDLFIQDITTRFDALLSDGSKLIDNVSFELVPYEKGKSGEYRVYVYLNEDSLEKFMINFNYEDLTHKSVARWMVKKDTLTKSMCKKALSQCIENNSRKV